MSQGVRQHLTYEEALQIAEEITQTPGCELYGVHDCPVSDEPAIGYIVHYWPLQEDGSRKRYLMVIERQIE